KTLTTSAAPVQRADAAAFGNAADAVSVTSGAVLDLNAQTVSNTNPLTLNGTGVGSGGALVNSSATAGSYAGTVALGSDSSIGTKIGRASGREGSGTYNVTEGG